MGGRPRDATAILSRSCHPIKSEPSSLFPQHVLSDGSQTIRILIDVDPSIVELYFSQRLEGLNPSAESYEDEVLALLEVIKILAGDDAELYARSVRDVISPAGAGHDARRSSHVLERAVESVLSSLRDGEPSLFSCVQLTDFERALFRRSLLWREHRDNVTDAARGRGDGDFLQSYSDGRADSSGL